MSKTLRVNAIFNIIRTLLNALFPFFTFQYASRMLGIENLGKVNYCISIINYFALFSSLGISMYAVREGSKYKEHKEEISRFVKEIIRIISYSFFITYFLFLICLFTIFDNKLKHVMLTLSMSILFTTFSLDWLFQIYEEYSFITIRSFIIQVIAIVIMLISIKTSEDYVKYAIVQVIGNSGGFFLNIFASRKYVYWGKKYTLNTRRHIKSVFIMFGISLASSIYLNIDSVMLGKMRCTYDVGLYSIASKVAQIAKVAITSISTVLIPRISYYAGTGKMNQYKYLFYKCFDRIMLLTMPSCIILAIFSEDIIYIISGIADCSANIAAKILSLNVIFAISSGILSYQVLLPHGREKFASICTIIGAITNVIFNIFVIPTYGVIGAAMTTIISEFIVLISLTIFSYNTIEIHKIGIICIHYLLLSVLPIVISVIVRYSPLEFTYRVIFSVILFCITYLIELKVTSNEFLQEMIEYSKSLRSYFHKI